MFSSHFAEHSLWVLLPSLALLFASIVCFYFDKRKAALITLVFAAFGLRIFMAGLDPFIHLWDERYHALVAKNMVNQPFKPMLFAEEILPYDYKQWIGNHVWLHKQPLSLWQIALGYKLFGVSAFTTRLPTVILSTLLLLLIYNIARKCFSFQTAYFAALIYCVSYFTLHFSSGAEAVDHVDFAFFFYVTASIWAWIEYDLSKKTKWRILIGVFAGLAVLTKWVTGLLVFAGWGIVVLLDEDQRRQFKSYFEIFKTFLISLSIFLPWQIYTFIRFPQEAFHELSYNRKHLYEVIEGHSGSFWYYIERTDENYGWLVPFIIIPAFYLFRRKIVSKNARNFLFAVLAVCYLFFSISATKMPAYCHAVCAIIFIALGVFAEYIYVEIHKFLNSFKWKNIAFILVTAGLMYLILDIKKIENAHTTKNKDDVNRDNQLRFSAYYKRLDKTLPDNLVVFGAPFGTEIEAMFYTGNIVYNGFPTQEKFNELKAKKRPMAIFESAETPEYLQKDPTIKKLVFNY